MDSVGLREGIKCPKCYKTQWQIDEWVATQVWTVYQECDYVYCMLINFCNQSKCPRMSAGDHVFYSFHDETTDRTENLCAIEYMKKTVIWAYYKLEDNELLPRDYGCKVKIPHDRFYDEVKVIMRRLFRIYAHAYLHHFNEIREHDARGGDPIEGPLNWGFKHFIFVALEFDLVEMADMVVLKGLIDKFMKQADERFKRDQVFSPQTVQYCAKSSTRPSDRSTRSNMTEQSTRNGSKKGGYMESLPESQSTRSRMSEESTRSRNGGYPDTRSKKGGYMESLPESRSRNGGY